MTLEKVHMVRHGFFLCGQSTGRWCHGLVTADPSEVTCKKCLRRLGRPPRAEVVR